jgi:hypothetical protein
MDTLSILASWLHHRLARARATGTPTARKLAKIGNMRRVHSAVEAFFRCPLVGQRKLRLRSFGESSNHFRQSYIVKTSVHASFERDYSISL